MVGVQSDEDRACLGDHVGVARERARAKERIFYCCPGQVLGAAHRDLNDPIRIGKLKSV